MWIAVAGSDRGVADARKELARAQGPGRAARGQDRRARRARRALEGRPPRRPQAAGGDRLGQAEPRRPDADRDEHADPLHRPGQGVPARRSHNVKRATFIGAGYPDYPWLFATDGEYTAFAAVALGQFEAIKDHLSALREISDASTPSSGKVAHEIVTDGSVYFGANADPGNTDETAKFPCAVALVWRWTGDDRFRDRLYDFSRRAMRYVTGKLDADKDGWPEGLGNVERDGMGEEKLDNAVYLIRGLYDLADMATRQARPRTRSGPRASPTELRASFDETWWNEESTQYADSLKAGEPVQQQHWIGVTPMEAELTLGGRATPGLADAETRRRARPARGGLLQRHRPVQPRPVPHRLRGRPGGKGEQIDLLAQRPSIEAVAEGNYGRLGEDAAAPLHGRQRAADARARRDARRAAGDPPVAGRPGRPNIGRCWTCRSMFMQAWGHYGTRGR